MSAFPPAGLAASRLSSAVGDVQTKPQSSAAWTRAGTGAPIDSGEQVQTGVASRAELTLDDGSKVALGPRSAFKLERSEGNQSFMGLSFGSMKAWVKKSFGTSFKVRTPTAVAAVRGTEFGLSVDELSKRTDIDLFKGLLAVDDNKGHSKLLNPGEHIFADQSGLGDTTSIEQNRRQSRQSERNRLKNEVGLAMSKEAVLAAAAREIKLSEYQQGKAMVDVSGNRVRLEEYIIRPQPNQFKLVVLNDRQSQLDYFFYLGTFNKALPTDLSLALRQLSGTPDAPPDWYLTDYRTGRSNTIDSVVEHAYGGHPVDVNNNGVASDAVTTYFDAAHDRFVSLNPGEPFFKTLFDYYRIWYNPTDPNSPQEPTALVPFPTGLTYRWDPSIGVTPFDGTPGSGIQNMSSNITTTIMGGNSNYNLDVSLPDGTLLHQRLKETYGTGNDYTQYDNFIIDDNGQVADLSAFAGASSGPSFKQTLLQWNFEQVITSSFFNGRKIDLVVEPKILIESGLSGFSQ